MATTKKPSGLTITRKGNKYTFKWKKGETYGDGQRLEWGYETRTNGTKSGTIKLSSSATSKTVSITPKGELALVFFQVRGKANSKSWSAWASETFIVKAPAAPTITASWNGDTPNKTIFDYSAQDDDHRPYDHCIYQTILVTNCPDNYKVESMWTNATKVEVSSTSGSIAHTEGYLTGSNARIYRIKAVGPGGSSEWRYAHHVYASPFWPENIRVTAEYNEQQQYVDLGVEWSNTITKMQHPIDSTVIRYTIGVPTAGEGLPTGATWTDAISLEPVTEGAWQGRIYAGPDEDEYLFIRVANKHDNWDINAATEIAYRNKLAKPTITSVTPNSGTHTIQVVLTKGTANPDASVAITYRDPDTGVVGVLSVVTASGTYNVVVPAWSDNPGDIGAYAFVGTSALQTTKADGTKIYSVESVVTSDTVWYGTPTAPTITAVRKDDETVSLSWNWPWADATNAEISWADRPDAWNSTSQPQTYDVANFHAASWNIGDLEQGKTWYFKVRLFYGENDTNIYGDYSNTASVDMSSAPKVPMVSLSDNVVKPDGSFTVSWAYDSTDGTKQAFAEIYEEEVNGELVYYYLLKTVKTETSAEINVDGLWPQGTTHAVVVGVWSESGHPSGYSDPEYVTVAEPLDCVIAQDSLVYDDIIINPETVTGNPATFDSGSDNVKEITSVEVPLTPKQAGTPWQGSTIYQTPYLFRKTPSINHSINSKYTTLVGADVAVNQLVSTASIRETRTVQGVQFTNNNDGSITLNGTASGTANAGEYNITSSIINGHVYLYTEIHQDSKLYLILRKAPTGNMTQGNIEIVNGNSYNITFKPQCTDLTAYFGSSAIADLAYTKEQATAGSGIAWLKSNGFDFSKYIAYNTGSLESVNPSAIVTRGFNQWDEEWELGNIGSDGIPYDSTTTIRSKNYIPALANTAYHVTQYGVTSNNIVIYFYDGNKAMIPYTGEGAYNNGYNGNPGNFTTPSGTAFMRFRCAAAYGATYNHDICINFNKTTGTPHNGDYLAYNAHTYDISSYPLNGIFKLDANNNIVADGDVRESRAVIHRYYGQVDLGTLTWEVSSYGDIFTASFQPMIMPSDNVYPKIITPKYVTTKNSNYAGLANMPDKSICCRTQNKYIQIRDSAYSTGAALKTALNGVYLTYELATPTAATADPFTNPQAVDADGTEEFVTSNNVPVGNQTRYADVYEITGTSSVDTHLRGHNQWDEETRLGYYNNGVFVGNTSTKYICNANPIPVIPNEQYYIKLPSTSGVGIYILYWDKDGNYLGYDNQRYVSTSFTMRADAGYIGIQMNNAYGQTYLNDISINYPSTDTSYHAYAGSDTTTALGQTVYEGTLDVVKGKLTVTKAEVDLGSQTWTYSSGAFRTTIPDMEYPTVSTIPADMICSIYETKAWAEGADNNIMAFHWSSTYQVAVIDSAYTDIADFKSHVTGAQLVYLLATPIEIDLTPTQIQALLGDNYVWSEQGTVTVKIADAVESGYFLDELPLTVTVTGAGNEGDTTMKIVRAEDYAMERPDGRDYNGYEGDLIVVKNQAGEAQMEVDLNDLVGRFDDGAKYRIVATTQDQFGQSAEATKDFVVRWSHQAVKATGTAVIDGDIAKITPTKPDGALDSDMVDIYRLSADAPVLIYEGATFGTTYVDPYPTIGETGGYRLVLRTKNGDYITANDIPSWTDYTAGLDTMFQYIDFDGNRLPLKYNVEIDESAEKIMEVTQYLGGATQGDSLEGYKGNGTVNGVIPYDLDSADYLLLRELKRYAGICHVRTKTGSNYTAFISVNDSAAYNSPGHVHNVGLTIQQFDNPVLDGLTLTDWQVS